jgi:adenine C2-methylase RlmN of 23S rRNA A2503 and tRNA A37
LNRSLFIGSQFRLKSDGFLFPLQKFKEKLNEKGILTTIRASRGQDIYAACGLLSTKEMVG